MTRTKKPKGCKGKQESSDDELEKMKRQDPLEDPQEQDRERDGHGVPKSNRDQGRGDSRAAPLLQAARQRKQPTHAGIEAVIGAKQDERDPRPGSTHG
jgi:hypothetical protein